MKKEGFGMEFLAPEQYERREKIKRALKVGEMYSKEDSFYKYKKCK